MIISQYKTPPIEYNSSGRRVSLFSKKFEHASDPYHLLVSGYKLVTREVSSKTAEPIYLERFGWIKDHVFHPFKHRYRTDDEVLCSVLIGSGLSSLFCAQTKSSIIPIMSDILPDDLSEEVLFTKKLGCQELGIFPDILSKNHLENIYPLKTITLDKLKRHDFGEWATDIPVTDVLTLSALKHLPYEINLKNSNCGSFFVPQVSVKSYESTHSSGVIEKQVFREHYAEMIDSLNLNPITSFNVTFECDNDEIGNVQLNACFNEFAATSGNIKDIQPIIDTFPVFLFDGKPAAVEVTRNVFDDISVMIKRRGKADDIDKFSFSLTSMSLHSLGYKTPLELKGF